MLTSYWEFPSSGSPFFGGRGVAEDLADFALSHLLDFDKSLETVDNEMRKLRRQMEANLRSEKSFQRALTSFENRPGNVLEHRTTLNPIKTTPDGSRTLKCAFDLHDFKPEEINVALDSKKNCICVEANHEVKDEKGRHAVTRNYKRCFYLPDDANVEDLSKLELKSQLTNDGMLWIEAPLPKLPKGELAKKTETKGGEEGRRNEPVQIEVKRI